MTYHRLPIAMLCALAFAIPAFAETLQQDEIPPPSNSDDVRDPDVPDDPDCDARINIIVASGGGGGGSSGPISFDWNGTGRMDFGMMAKPGTASRGPPIRIFRNTP